MGGAVAAAALLLLGLGALAVEAGAAIGAVNGLLAAQPSDDHCRHSTTS